MTNTTSVQGSSRNAAGLDSRYGEIGIPAVAAALQYCGDARTSDGKVGETKTAGSAPVPQPQTDRWNWHADLAA